MRRKWKRYVVKPYKNKKLWHLKSKDCREYSTEMELADPDSNMSPSEVMDFYSMTYPELTTATVHGPEWENDRTVYRFKTTIGTKG